MSNILTDKQYREYNKLSRYTTVPYYYHVNDGKYVYGVASNLSTDTPYKVHKVIEGDSLDSLALYYYNNPTYYWIIADYNRIQDPFVKLTVGEHIKIPTFSAIEFEE